MSLPMQEGNFCKLKVFVETFHWLRGTLYGKYSDLYCPTIHVGDSCAVGIVLKDGLLWEHKKTHYDKNKKKHFDVILTKI